jgi:hypothetical protein
MWYVVGMPPAKRVIKRQKPTTAIDATVTDYLANRSMRERSSAMEDSIKKTLMEVLAAQGELKEGGHRQIDLAAPQDFASYKAGKLAPKVITGIERKRRVSQSLNEERTMALLKEKNLVDECTEIVVVLNEDAVLGANYGGKISDEELAALYDESETFAFYLVEGRA